LPLWNEILTAVTGLPARRRRSGEAASAGAAMVAARATGIELDLERLDPVDVELSPDPSTVASYAALRPAVDAAAAAVIDLGR
jgi:sugar (pentulose or hexulose) kinase